MSMPLHAGHRLGSMPSQDSGPRRDRRLRGGEAVWVGGVRWGVGGQALTVAVDFLAWAFCLRMEAPERESPSLLWTSRSRIASARVGSPRQVCHWSIGSWLVMRVVVVPFDRRRDTHPARKRAPVPDTCAPTSGPDHCSTLRRSGCAKNAGYSNGEQSTRHQGECK